MILADVVRTLLRLRNSPATTSAPARSALEHSFPAILLFVAVVAAFWPAFSAGFILDDDVMVTDNPLMRGPLGNFWFTTKPIDFFPLTYTTLWLEWRHWGMNPIGYHVTNVLLHGLSCIILWRIFERLKFPGAWFAALLFAVHPVNVESVAWVAERKNVLAMFFFTITAWAFIRYTQTDQKRFYGLSLTAFVLSLLAKPAAAPWPVVAFALMWWTSRNAVTPSEKLVSPWPLVAKCFVRTLPFFLLTIVLSAATVWFQYNRAIGKVDGHLHYPDLLTRMTAAASIPWFYLGKALVPWGLTLAYPLWNVNPHALIYWLPAVAFLALFMVLWVYRERGAKPYLVGLAYFVLLISPVLGFFKMASHRYCFVADRWEYFALPAVTVLVAITLKRFKFFNIAAVIIATTFACLSFAQAKVYRNHESLWRDALQKNPSSWLAANGLGFSLQAAGRLDDAIACYNRSLGINPDQAEAHCNIGDALLSQGKTILATEHFREAIRIDPTYATSHYNLACVLQQEGKIDEAVSEYREALRTHSDWAHAHYNLGTALQQQGKVDEAIAEFRLALKYDDHYAPAYNNLGCLLAMQGKHHEGIAQIQRALELVPNYPDSYFNIGTILLDEHKPVEAIPFLQKAVASTPGKVEARVNLGKAFLAVKQLQTAQEQFTDALALNPRHEGALYNMANCLRLAGQTNQAVERYEEVLAQNPKNAECHFQLATLLLSTDRKQAAIDHLREAARLNPNWIQPINNLAWYLATDPNSTPADHAQAVHLAEHAVELSRGRNPVTLDTLGTAWARNQVFAKASDAARRAIEVATVSGQTNLVADIQKRLALYASGTAYIER